MAFSGLKSPRINLRKIYPPTIFRVIDFPLTKTVYKGLVDFKNPTWKFPLNLFL
jgi:hypothetical protein